MNTQEMMRILDSIARDRNIERSVLIADLEQAMVSAARKYFNTLDTEEFTRSNASIVSKLSRTLPASICEMSRMELISFSSVSPFSMMVRT